MKLRWTRRATADLNRMAARIAAADALAAGEFVMTIRARVERLAQFPVLGRPGALDDTRELVVHRNYILTYRLRRDEAQVLQIRHVARNRPRGKRA